MRISEKILIIGNGGVKDTKTYNENNELNGYVIDLQKFDLLINKAIDEGTISIEENEIRWLENNEFKI